MSNIPAEPEFQQAYNGKQPMNPYQLHRNS